MEVKDSSYQTHADDVKPLLTKPGENFIVEDNYKHHYTKLFSNTSSFKRKPGRRPSIPSSSILSVLLNHKLILHIFTSVLLVTYLTANINYLWFKLKLYYKELPFALGSPWTLIILACEVVYLICGLISAVDYLLPPVFNSPPTNAKTLHNNLMNFGSLDATLELTASKSYPTVDVMIPCCKEPTEIPQESILAALALNYPKSRFKVIVLDDGGDDGLKAFCETIRVESGNNQLLYLRRKKIPGVPHNFKCGNMNYGLKHSDAEYIVMMDADMILHPSFLSRLLPYIISSPQVSFVQIPQSFYNLPEGDPLNDACGFFYDRTLVHRNTLGCATCVGTGCIFRRKHLDEIGGLQPQSITEDTITAYTLFNRGYRCAYVNEKLQIGLVPWTFEGFMKQRERWGQGAVQQLAATWRDMLGRRSKLNILQKVCYFWHTGYYFMSIPNVILVLTLWSALAFRLNLVIGNDEDNKTLLSYIAVYLLSWRLFWYAVWMEVPQSIQSRNRDESSFWWMTPFFVRMIVDSTFNFKKTFNFVPTSNIDQAAARGKAKQHIWMKKLNEFKHVQVHIAFIIMAISAVLIRSSTTITSYGLLDCREGLTFLGLSIFVLSVCVHMSVPLIHILWPTGFRPEQRKSLLKYDSTGVPTFDPSKVMPKWHPSVLLFELVSFVNIGFWIFIFWAANTDAFARFCPRRTVSL
ncbi:hypothetical protein KP509_08G050100 [Ceratopteris richardii]|uniref:Cellulose synthase (UDP-forming) n=1 Tax=Ceratopteris richardii TaxID=49495 RepID=A0A8T2U7W9_CERRI|nr:hypothetical protein KP509_08G050100 [Ceratopteris richardii]